MKGFSVSNSHDLTVFLCMFACGCVICLIFDVFRAARKAAPPSGLLLVIQDVALCMTGFFIFNKAVDVLNSGELRWYVFAGCLLGGVVYFLYISSVMLKCMIFLFQKLTALLFLLTKGIKKLLAIVLAPFIKLKNYLTGGFSDKKIRFRQLCIKNLSKKRENDE